MSKGTRIRSPILELKVSQRASLFKSDKHQEGGVPLQVAGHPIPPIPSPTHPHPGEEVPSHVRTHWGRMIG